MRALPASQEISLDDGYNLITKEKILIKLMMVKRVKYNLMKLGSEILSIYLQSIFDALINITNFNKRFGWLQTQQMN